MKLPSCLFWTVSFSILTSTHLVFAAISPVHGVVEKISKDSITITSALGTLTAPIGPKMQFVKRVPSDLSKITAKSYVGVTTVKQPDGKEMATEIHIFPENMRGANEGSFMMETAAPATPKNRMTNGTVAAAHMKKTMRPSRMTNGTVEKKEGSSSMLVQFKGGQTEVVIPEKVTVTELVVTDERPAAGAQISFIPEKKNDGSYTTSRINLLNTTK